MSMNFFNALQNRRTYYGISKETPVPEARIQEIVAFALNHTPSAFNSQSARIILLSGQHHDRLWSITKDALKKIVPADHFQATSDKIDSFGNGYGTVLFFEDQAVIEGLQKNFAAYKDNFPIWSNQSSGMHQLVIWTALETEGLGASLQHYGELIESEVKAEWQLPDAWKLIAQMPFGKPVAQPGEKQMQPLDSRMRVFK